MRPLILGHRGTRLGAPENSLAAMQLALRQGGDGIEIDVRPCASGEVVVAHDRDLLRVAGVAREIAELTFTELSQCDLGGGERIPTLRRTLDLVLGQGRILNVELKADVPDMSVAVRAVVDELLRCSSSERERIWLSSFSASMCRMLCAALPEMMVALVFEDEAELPAGTRAVHPQYELVTAARVASWHAAGLRVHAWTVNDPRQATALAAAGVDALITDDVPRVLGALA